MRAILDEVSNKDSCEKRVLFLQLSAFTEHYEFSWI